MLRNTNLTTEHRVRLIYNKLALNYRKYPRIGIYAQTGVNTDGTTTGFSTKLGDLEFAIEKLVKIYDDKMQQYDGGDGILELFIVEY